MEIFPMLSTSTGMMAWRDRSQKVCTPVVRIPELGSQPRFRENRMMSMMANQKEGMEMAT